MAADGRGEVIRRYTHCKAMNGDLACFWRTQMDVTEVFRQIPREKNIRIAKLIFYLLGFVYFIYRCAPLPSCT